MCVYVRDKKNKNEWIDKNIDVFCFILFLIDDYVKLSV